jgi:hypothetical protein
VVWNATKTSVKSESRKRKKDLEHVFIGVLCSNKKRRKNMLEGGATLTVSHMKRRHAMKAA